MEMTKVTKVSLALLLLGKNSSHKVLRAGASMRNWDLGVGGPGPGSSLLCLCGHTEDLRSPQASSSVTGNSGDSPSLPHTY